MSIHHDGVKNSGLFSINGTSVVMPAEITYTRSDLDSENSFRTVTGDLQRDRITVKRKLECQWSGLDGEELAEILQAMSAVFFTVRFLDPYTNSMDAMVAYVGDRSPITAMYKKDGTAIYESFSCSLIEK